MRSGFIQSSDNANIYYQQTTHHKIPEIKENGRNGSLMVYERGKAKKMGKNKYRIYGVSTQKA